MNRSPYFRTFVAGAVWYTAMAIRSVSQEGWNSDQRGSFLIIGFAWIVSSLLLGVIATKFEKMRSWWNIGIGTVAGSFVVLGIILLMTYIPRPPEFKNTDEMMQYYADRAVQMAGQYHHVKLDYRPDSIKEVEAVLGKLHEDYVRTKPSDRAVRDLAMTYGAYIGEVIRRTESGAHWERGDSVGGQDSYPIVWSAGSSYVCAWCYRRITVGEEDNVWLKYLMVRDENWKKPPEEGIEIVTNRLTNEVPK